MHQVERGAWVAAMQWWAGARPDVTHESNGTKHKRRSVIQTLLPRLRLTHPTRYERWNPTDTRALFVPNTIERASVEPMLLHYGGIQE